MKLRSVNPSEVDLIEYLFQNVYRKQQGTDYWKWCFLNPYGYINAGMFENNRLIGYYAAQFTKNSACLYSAMVHPKHRNKGIFMELSNDLLGRLSHERDYIYLFSNETIRNIHVEKEGFVEAYQIVEYRIPIDKSYEDIIYPGDQYIEPYLVWRYRNHPLVKYIFDYRGIFSYYEDRIQIIDYDTNNLEKAIELAKYLGYWDKKKYVSFWSEIDYSCYPFEVIPTWKQYKIFDKNINLKDIIQIEQTRMGQSDVF